MSLLHWVLAGCKSGFNKLTRGERTPRARRLITAGSRTKTISSQSCEPQSAPFLAACPSVLHQSQTTKPRTRWSLVTSPRRMRSAVVFAPNGWNIVHTHMPEMPTRLSKHLVQMFRGLLFAGHTRDNARRLAARLACDCISPLRVAVLQVRDCTSRSEDPRHRQWNETVGVSSEA